MPAAMPSFRSSIDGAALRWRPLLLLALVVMLALLQQRLWFGKGGRDEVQVLQRQVSEQVRVNAGLRRRNAMLAAEVRDLKSGEAAIEERARSELGMIKPGETFYRVVERAGAASSAAREDGQ